MGVGRAREPVLPASSRILRPQPSVPECAVCPCPVGDASCISQGPGRGGGRGKLVLVVSHSAQATVEELQSNSWG